MKFLPIYDELAKVAARLLSSYLLPTESKVSSHTVHEVKRSDTMWEIAIIHNGSSARMFSEKVIVTWKPILWLVKGTKPKTFEFFEDSVEKN
ncbi:MAG: hypothetical protein WA667_28600 [Candidatus Nitrosopolaris sp.]